jgi:hypothetical protein
MKFGFSFIPEVKGSPDWFSSFKSHYDQVIKFMSGFTSQGVSVRENVVGSVNAITVQHKQPRKIPHNLNSTPSIVNVVGRVVVWSKTASDSTSVTITPILISTNRKTGDIGSTTYVVQVTDISLFREGDRILIDGQVRTIQRIENSSFRLDAEIILPVSDIISLFEETIEIAIY